MSRRPERIAFAFLLQAVAVFSTSAAGWHHIENVQHVGKLPDGVELTAGAAKVRITAYRDGIVRVRVSPLGAFEKDYSWPSWSLPLRLPSNSKTAPKNCASIQAESSSSSTKSRF